MAILRYVGTSFRHFQMRLTTSCDLDIRFDVDQFHLIRTKENKLYIFNYFWGHTDSYAQSKNIWLLSEQAHAFIILAKQE